MDICRSSLCRTRALPDSNFPARLLHVTPLPAELLRKFLISRVRLGIWNTIYQNFHPCKIKFVSAEHAFPAMHAVAYCPEEKHDLLLGGAKALENKTRPCAQLG
jgi:hypothetical protein